MSPNQIYKIFKQEGKKETHYVFISESVIS